MSRKSVKARKLDGSKPTHGRIWSPTSSSTLTDSIAQGRTGARSATIGTISASTTLARTLWVVTEATSTDHPLTIWLQTLELKQQRTLKVSSRRIRWQMRPWSIDTIASLTSCKIIIILCDNPGWVQSKERRRKSRISSTIGTLKSTSMKETTLWLTKRS